MGGKWEVCAILPEFVILVLTKIMASADMAALLTGQDKALIPACPLDKHLSNFASPGQGLVYFCFNLVGRRIAWVPIGQVRSKSFLPGKKIFTTCPRRPDGTFFEP